ncbi:helix-turn-helix domain-containing protein [Confluentibacter flavum]|uniref:AraC family transcriptional regulator n=1 Tax=Confluentibacter flavum TaxID=1909700 RepID=A0A2N3HJX2_9FLAO|nr:AraC family transcriptional regulator [Confluentibacter flavum]PKQ45138.1 AraC family transcriptional regulator [Confluentibacter flavum]
MKTVSITSNSLSVIFDQIQAELGGKLDIKSKEYKLELNNDIVKGFISGVSIEKAIVYMEYSLVFKEDVTFLNRLSETNSMYFGYCSKGHVKQSFEGNGKENKLGQFQTGIFSNSSENNIFFSFEKNKKVEFSMVTVDVLSVSDKELRDQLKITFILDQQNSVYSYIGSFNLKIVEKINHLKSLNQKGLVRNLLINSVVYLILALEIEQHKNDLSNAMTNYYSLTQTDMEAVKDIAEHIRSAPEIQYSLKYLSRKSGLSPFKLQEGFKILHNRTVTDFIRNIRIEVAENLIRTTELNISEIVYSVGLTSRSYFSKIFKEKYNCSPKHYQNHQNILDIKSFNMNAV